MTMPLMTMPLAICRGPLCALVLTLVVAAPCRADDNDFTLPESLKETLVDRCKDDGAKVAGCKDGSLTRQAQAVDATFKAALAKAKPATAVLLKRDQAWFAETAEPDSQTGDADAPASLPGRLIVLKDMLDGFGRSGLAGRWGNAFGSVAITPAGDSAVRITMATRTFYAEGDGDKMNCKARALLHARADGWFAGEADLIGVDPHPDRSKPSIIKIRLQGQTLRVIAGDEMHPRERHDIDCGGPNQLTGTYFPLGKADASAGAASFVAPTFDCAKPATASEEEICADPELADNDQRLNRAWKALLPRLDAVTRKWLIEDQRNWLKTQSLRYPNALHPAQAKQSYFAHYTAAARDSLAQLQRERIALLEGFDDKRRGFEGDWVAYNARVSITRDKDGKLDVDGDKWFEDDYKGGCDYAFKGRAVGDTFKPDDTSSNPDSMVRDHATLIVNPTDDEAAKHRFDKAGNLVKDAEQKCRRRFDISSTARLFPVKAADKDR